MALSVGVLVDLAQWVWEAFRIVHVLIAGQTTEHGLAQQARQQVARVLAAPQVRQGRAAQISQAKDLVQLAVGQEPSVGGDRAAVELALQAPVEIDAQMRLSGVTHRVRRTWSVSMMVLH